MFEFLDTGPMTDGELSLELAETSAADPVWDGIPSYFFHMRVPDAPEPVGGISLRVGHTLDLDRYAGHIGFRVEPRHRGRRYAERSCRLILPLARRHGMTTLWITCNPENAASRRTCERLGAAFVEVVDLPPDSPLYLRGDRQKCRYRLDLEP
jgi:predicted acetyltransferase